MKRMKLEDIIGELKQIANELGIKVNNARVLAEYKKRNEK